MKTFKITNGDDIRVVTMQVEGKFHPTYLQLRNKVRSLYPNTFTDTTSMVYRDSEGDIVTIVDDDSVRAVVIDAASKQSPNVRIMLRTEASIASSIDSNIRSGCRDKQQRGVGAHWQCPFGESKGKCSPGGWFMSALSPFSLRTLGVAFGLRCIFGMSWCSIIGLGLLRHFYLETSWRRGCHGGRMWTASCPPWWHIQGPSNFRMSTPFFTVVGNANSHNNTNGCRPNRRCGPTRHVPRQHGQHSDEDTTKPNAAKITEQYPEGMVSDIAQAEDTMGPSSPASTVAAALIDEVVQSVGSYMREVDAKTDAVMVHDNIADTEGTSSESEKATEVNENDDVEQKVKLIKSMGFDLNDETIAAFVKEMNGRVDLIVSALLKNTV